MKRGFATLVATLCLAVIAGSAWSAPLQYKGALELRSPVHLDTPGPTSWSPDLKYLDLAGHLTLFQEGSPLSLWVAGEHSFSRGYGVRENELKVGVDYKVGKSCPLTLFSYYERRYDLKLDRVFVGARLGFKGSLE